MCLSLKSLGGGTLHVNSGYLCGSGLGVLYFPLAGTHLFIHIFRIYLLISPRYSSNYWQHNGWQDRHSFCYQGLYARVNFFSTFPNLSTMTCLIFVMARRKIPHNFKNYVF